ncbi:MAG: 4Fe-4S dicluster domain-containing protein [Candidatus Dormibacteria bacterium]
MSIEDQHGITPLLPLSNPWDFGTPPPAAEPMGFLTDATLCIGCKACEVACKQWNGLADDGMNFEANSYDNTGHLGAGTWRHVKFLEEFTRDRTDGTWSFISDVCKHCKDAGCLNSCPTGAIVRTEFDTVYVQDDICNGCGYCIPSCPFGVIARSSDDGGAHKCTHCYDRLKDGMAPACATSCPTESIVFGPVEELRERARNRVATLRARGDVGELYGDSKDLAGGLNSLFILDAPAEKLGLPTRARTGRHNLIPSYAGHLAVGLAWIVIAGWEMRRRTR